MDHLISHNGDVLKANKLEIEQKLTKSELLSLPLENEIDILAQLFEFELGRFLLQNKGLNGYWTSYIISNGLKKDKLHPLEEWILKSAPTVLATRERFGIFKQILQKSIKNGHTIASVPCGLMDDLLDLNYANLTDVKLIGVDLDESSVKLAKENAKKKQPRIIKSITFKVNDAWSIKNDGQKYDIITSNGLNIYEPNDEKVIDLYKSFYNSMNENGIFVGSFLTPPPTISKNSTWRSVNKENLQKQKAIFSDIIGVNWQSFRTENQTIDQLKKAGFKKIEITYDSQGIFPTFIAFK